MIDYRNYETVHREKNFVKQLELKLYLYEIHE